MFVINSYKQAIGNLTDIVAPYTNNKFELQKNDCIYLFTDGYADQFGGPKGKKFMRKQFEKTLIEASNKPINEQKQFVEDAFCNWKGDLEQVDDICVIGIKI